MEKNSLKLYQTREDLNKNDIIVIGDNEEIRKATKAEIDEHNDYQELMDELVDYCDLNYIENVIEIIRDTVKHHQEKVIRAMRIHEEHSSKKCTDLKCSCKFKHFNTKVKEQKIKEEEFKNKNNL